MTWLFFMWEKIWMICFFFFWYNEWFAFNNNQCVDNVNVVETNHDQVCVQLCVNVRAINEVKQEWVTNVLLKKIKANVYNKDFILERVYVESQTCFLYTHE